MFIIGLLPWNDCIHRLLSIIDSNFLMPCPITLRKCGGDIDAGRSKENWFPKKNDFKKALLALKYNTILFGNPHLGFDCCTHNFYVCTVKEIAQGSMMAHSKAYRLDEWMENVVKYAPTKKLISVGDLLWMKFHPKSFNVKPPEYHFNGSWDYFHPQSADVSALSAILKPRLSKIYKCNITDEWNTEWSWWEVPTWTTRCLRLFCALRTADDNNIWRAWW